MPVLGVWPCLAMPTAASSAGFYSSPPVTVDVMFCPACGGRLWWVAVLSDPDSISSSSYLSGAGLAADPPAMAPARLPPQRALNLVVWSYPISCFFRPLTGLIIRRYGPSVPLT